MKKSEIKVGGHYLAKVNSRLVTVRVDKIGDDDVGLCHGEVVRHGPYYDVTNLATGRRTIFRSAVKFRGVSAAPKPTNVEEVTGLVLAGETRLKVEEVEHTVCEQTIACLADMAESGEQCGECGGIVPEAEQRPDPSLTCAGGNPTTLGSSSSTAGDGPTGATPAHPVGQLSEPTGTNTMSVSAPSVPLSGLASKILASQSNGPQASHLIIEARAGTGKTTTLVEGLKRVKGLPSPFTPSPQQAAIWEAMAQGPAPQSICFVAFNKSIAVELQRRVPAGCEAMTMHSMGFKAVMRAFPQLRGRKLNEYRTQAILAELLGRDPFELRKDPKMWVVLRAVTDLVGLCKMNLVGNGFDAPGFDRMTDTYWAEELDKLASHYEVELNGSKSQVYDLVPEVLEVSKDPERGGMIGFDDMIWLPVVLDLPVYRYDLLLVDEAQDLNRCQQALAKKAGKRLILCGDPKQAIYGFAGADSESMQRMERELADFERPDGTRVGHVQTLPLTVTRRCGKAIVEEARKIVPDFEAHESNPEGVISTARMKENANTSGQLTGGVPQPRELRDGEVDYTTIVQDGDFLLCRVNAPLVSQCFRFLKAGRKATIQGRDIGQGLITLVNKLSDKGNAPVEEFTRRLDGWLAGETRRERAKTYPSEAQMIALQDKADCLHCFAEDVVTVREVITRIEAIFTDDKDKPGIRLSSIHKAKGLEARRVFLLEPEGCGVPHPMARSDWQVEQELHLRYVAITRAIEELCFVS